MIADCKQYWPSVLQNQQVLGGKADLDVFTGNRRRRAGIVERIEGHGVLAERGADADDRAEEVHAVDLAVQRRLAIAGGSAEAHGLRAHSKGNLVASLVAVEALEADRHVLAVDGDGAGGRIAHNRIQRVERADEGRDKTR